MRKRGIIPTQKQVIMSFSPIINKEEAPDGFVPVFKRGINSKLGDNICRYCDARPLCQENENSWCAKNPCMSYSRIDGIGVVFKKKKS